MSHELFKKLSDHGQKHNISLFAEEAKKYGIINEIAEKIPISFKPL